MKKNSGKLSIDRETLRQLATKTLEGVQGGSPKADGDLSCRSMDYKSCQDPTGAGN